MELEKLTKTQTVLLTLLVSFVTSIATGITTVTLMDQAAPGATYSISKVVERTIEKVVPEKTQGASTIKTVIVKEENLIAEAVARNTPYLVRITKPGIGEGAKSIFVASGFVLQSSGIVVTDSLYITGDVKYDIELSGGGSYQAKAVFQDKKQGVALLAISLEEGKTIGAVGLTNSDSVKLGQTAISLSGIYSPSISVGVVSHFRTETRPVDMFVETEDGTGVIDEEKEVEMLEYVNSLETTVSKDVPSGSLLLDSDGDMIGINIVREADAYTVPSNILKEYIAVMKKLKTEVAE